MALTRLSIPERPDARLPPERRTPMADLTASPDFAPDVRGPVRRAVYGASRRLGDVEFLSARFGAHRFAPHSHPVFAIGTVLSGACRIWHRGSSYVARPGDLVLINPGDPHSADPASAGEWDYAALYFSGDAAELFLPSSRARGASRTLGGVVGHDPALARSLSGLCTLLEHDPEQARGEAAFARFVRALFGRFSAASDAAPVDVDAERLERVRAHLEQHFAEAVRIEALAELVGQSPFRVIRAFTHRFGMPPYAYLQHVRVARACSMLRTGAPITATAATVGFADQSHLTRCFRRITGVPPGVYARAMCEGKGDYRRSATLRG